jgi:transcriptional repressor NF-X1
MPLFLNPVARDGVQNGCADGGSRASSQVRTPVQAVLTSLTFPISVQLIRRIDTRIPFPLLSAAITPSAPPSLGKLADLRSPSAQSVRPLKPSSSNPSRTATPVGSSNRGWTSVVSTSAAAANPAPAATSWMTSGNGRPSAPRPVVTAAQPVAAALPVQPDVSGSDVPDSWEDDA